MSEYKQIFTVGDIHGCKDLLDNIHQKIIKVSMGKKGEKPVFWGGGTTVLSQSLKRLGVQLKLMGY